MESGQQGWHQQICRANRHLELCHGLTPSMYHPLLQILDV